MRILQRNLKRTTDTHYRHTPQTHTTDTHHRHTPQTHTTDTHYRHIPFHFSHNERTPVQISLQYLHGVRVIKEMPGSVASGTPYTGCHRRNGPNFGRVFLMLNYTDITQNTCIQSWTVAEIMAREKCGHLAFPRNVRLQLCSALNVRLWRHKLRPTR